MPLYDFFRSFFGFPNNHNEHLDDDRSKNCWNNYRDPSFGGSNPDYDDHNDNVGQFSGFDNGMGFQVFTDPLQMHRYFEHQMNEMIKSFGSMFGSDDNVCGCEEFPTIGSPSHQEVPKQNLRDHFLKPGYENSKDFTPKSDTDLDGKVNLGDLDSILKEVPSQVMPYEESRQVRPQFRVFGQSVTSRTVVRQDGTIEKQYTTRDGQGNEETTVTRQIGDKQYSVTTKTDKHGHREQIENLTNIDETEIFKFTDDWHKKSDCPLGEPDLNKQFPFDKFFK